MEEKKEKSRAFRVNNEFFRCILTHQPFPAPELSAEGGFDSRMLYTLSMIKRRQPFFPSQLVALLTGKGKRSGWKYLLTAGISLGYPTQPNARSGMSSR